MRNVWMRVELLPQQTVRACQYKNMNITTYHTILWLHGLHINVAFNEGIKRTEQRSADNRRFIETSFRNPVDKAKCVTRVCVCVYFNGKEEDSMDRRVENCEILF